MLASVLVLADGRVVRVDIGPNRVRAMQRNLFRLDVHPDIPLGAPARIVQIDLVALDRHHLPDGYQATGKRKSNSRSEENNQNSHD